MTPGTILYVSTVATNFGYSIFHISIIIE